MPPCPARNRIVIRVSVTRGLHIRRHKALVAVPSEVALRASCVIRGAELMGRRLVAVGLVLAWLVAVGLIIGCLVAVGLVVG